MLCRSDRSEVVGVLSHVSDDLVMGADGGTVGSSLAVDGSSVNGVSASEFVESVASAVGGDASVVGGDSVLAGSPGVDSDGSSHRFVGLPLDSLGVGSVVVGLAVASEPDTPVMGAPSHPSDGLGDSASARVESGVPEAVGAEGVAHAAVGGAESGEGDLVVVHGSHLGLEGLSHLGVGPLVGSDGLRVASDFPSVGSVPSEEVATRGSSSVLGGEVAVGADVSGADESHVLAEVSHAGGLGLLEGAHAVEEGGVSERTGLSWGLSGGAVIPPALSSTGAVRNSLFVVVSLETVHALLAVGVSIAISFTHLEAVSSFTVDLGTVEGDVSAFGGGRGGGGEGCADSDLSEHSCN